MAAAALNLTRWLEEKHQRARGALRVRKTSGIRSGSRNRKLSPRKKLHALRSDSAKPEDGWRDSDRIAVFIHAGADVRNRVQHDLKRHGRARRKRESAWRRVLHPVDRIRLLRLFDIFVRRSAEHLENRICSIDRVAATSRPVRRLTDAADDVPV